MRRREGYVPVARDPLDDAARPCGELRLIADARKVGFGHPLRIVAIAFRCRAIPLVWTWVPRAEGHSSALQQRALPAYVPRLIPAGTPVLLGWPETVTGDPSVT
ncbi:MAG: hypothetical protein ACK4OK_03895 [Thermoflexus sp.]